MEKNAFEILEEIKESYLCPLNEIIACFSGLSLGLTEKERADLKSGKLEFRTAYENKKLLRESGLVTHPEVPDFPWNS